MTLNEWAASKKTAVFERLLAGKAPEEGSYDEAALKDAIARGSPQMGATTFEQQMAHIEFIFPSRNEPPTVFRVSLQTPERIVFLPVPSWVIETIWQGDVDGSYHFESHAAALVARFAELLGPDANAEYFRRRPPNRRE